jgi:hypothetical protein
MSVRPSEEGQYTTADLKIRLTYSNSRDVAYDHVEKHDEQEAKGSTFTPCGLTVHFGEREGSTAVNDSIKIGDAVQDSNGVAESCDQTQRDLGENCLGKIDFRIGELWWH